MNLTISHKAKTVHPLSAQLIPSRYNWLSLELAEPNLGVPPNVVLNPNSTTETWVLTSDYLGFRGWASYDPLNFPFFSLERPDLETVGDAIEELIYKDPNPLRFFLLHPTQPTTPRTNVVIELGDPFWCNTASLSWVSNKVNPLATFPGQGVVAFGQKTLQTKASALDRVNVRRLLITLKRYIGNIADNLVFEQNTATTRNRFLNQVNPYLETVQQKQGLYAYKVVMDESNNTAETIDRNQLVGAIYLQPTKTAEFIILDFNITPTGVQFS
jgi:hypothetical protein